MVDRKDEELLISEGAMGLPPPGPENISKLLQFSKPTVETVMPSQCLIYACCFLRWLDQQRWSSTILRRPRKLQHLPRGDPPLDQKGLLLQRGNAGIFNRKLRDGASG